MKKLLPILIIFIIASSLTGCWNYREIERLTVVSGVAIDRSGNGDLTVTFEVLDISSGEKSGAIEPIYIEMDGETFFDATRRAIILSGKKLYWGHNKVAVLSEEVAEQDVDRVLDFLTRDSEMRDDMWLLVAKDCSAREILQSKPLLEQAFAFEMDNMFRAHDYISRYPSVPLYAFRNKIKGNKDSGFLPAATTVSTAHGETFQMAGTAVFKKSSLAGWLDENDSRYLLWIRSELEGGLIVLKNAAGSTTDVAMEILKNKTTVKPLVFQDGKIAFEIDVDTAVNIGELQGSADFMSKPGREALAKEAEQHIKDNIESFIKKIQEEYNSDVFGFGRKLETRYPKVWKEIKDDWDELFSEVETTVNVKVRITGSSINRKPILTGE